MMDLNVFMGVLLLMGTKKPAGRRARMGETGGAQSGVVRVDTVNDGDGGARYGRGVVRRRCSLSYRFVPFIQIKIAE